MNRTLVFAIGVLVGAILVALFAIVVDAPKSAEVAVTPVLAEIEKAEENQPDVFNMIGADGEPEDPCVEFLRAGTMILRVPVFGHPSGQQIFQSDPANSLEYCLGTDFNNIGIKVYFLRTREFAGYVDLRTFVPAPTTIGENVTAATDSEQATGQSDPSQWEVVEEPHYVTTMWLNYLSETGGEVRAQIFEKTWEGYSSIEGQEHESLEDAREAVEIAFTLIRDGCPNSAQAGAELLGLPDGLLMLTFGDRPWDSGPLPRTCLESIYSLDPQRAERVELEIQQFEYLPEGFFSVELCPRNSGYEAIHIWDNASPYTGSWTGEMYGMSENWGLVRDEDPEFLNRQADNSRVRIWRQSGRETEVVGYLNRQYLCPAIPPYPNNPDSGW